ncbi:unnamed protein product [Amoebophrya sp. A25]|nr:unnamed protein product [Amoebophrya sp. A25]|eukprot:GSA25T00022918001.1
MGEGIGTRLASIESLWTTAKPNVEARIDSLEQLKHEVVDHDLPYFVDRATEENFAKTLAKGVVGASNMTSPRSRAIE